MSPPVAVHQVQLVDMQPQPWRNGGGVMRDLLVWPGAAANAGGWQLRISVADISSDGPFSVFDGVERWFGVLHGAGVRLQLAGQSHLLRVGSPPLCFDGAAAPGCTLLGGAAQALNLLLRRDAGTGAMLAVDVDVDGDPDGDAGAGWHSPAPWRAVFCTGAAQLHIDGQAAAALPDAGLLWCDQAAGQAWRIDKLAPAARAWWLCFQPTH